MMKHKGDYPEFVGKTIRRITASNDEDWRCITIDFTDGTSIAFHLNVCLSMKPETYRLKDGDVVTRSIRKYPAVRGEN